jgi:RNA polymerase sigma-70 factor, ECF subfamily
LNEKLLIQTFLKNRTRQNFLSLFNRYSGSLMRVAVYLVRGDRDLAEDLMQDTWIAAIENLEHFAGKSSLKSWLTGILMNKYRDFLRRRKNWQTLDSVQTGGSHSSGELSVDLRNAIMQLPEGYRQILILHDLEGFMHHEIAELLSIHPGTSKSQLFHARRAMRSLLNEYKVG